MTTTENIFKNQGHFLVGSSPTARTAKSTTKPCP